MEQQYSNCQLREELAEVHRQLHELRQKEQHYLTQQTEMDQIVKWMKISNSRPQRSLAYAVKKLQQEILILRESLAHMQTFTVNQLREHHELWEQAMLNLLKIGGKSAPLPAQPAAKR